MQNGIRFLRMDHNSQLYTQFKNCAPAIGGEQQASADPKQGAFRVYTALQDYFVDLFKIVLDRGFDVDVHSENPEAIVKPGNPNPHLGDLFVVIEPGTRAAENFASFALAMAPHQSQRLHANLLNGNYVLQFRAPEMEQVLRTALLPERSLEHDEQVRRHMNAVHHLLGRVENDQYKPAYTLN